MKYIDLFSGSLNKYLILCFFLFTSFSCKDDPVKPPDKVDFPINVEDVSYVEAFNPIVANNKLLKEKMF